VEGQSDDRGKRGGAAQLSDEERNDRGSSHGFGILHETL